MIDLQTLLLFSATVLALLISPGPNMAFLLSHGLSHGPRGGLAVALGIFLADLVLTGLTAAGVTAIVAAWPLSFDLLKLLGACYLLWLAFQAVRSHKGGQRNASLARTEARSHGHIVRAGMLNSLLNPKALLFFMVFLPQFVTPQHGSVPVQLLTLGLVLSAISLLFHGTLGLFSGRLGALFQRSAAGSRYFSWLHAGVFAGLAVRLFLLERPSH